MNEFRIFIVYICSIEIFDLVLKANITTYPNKFDVEGMFKYIYKRARSLVKKTKSC